MAVSDLATRQMIAERIVEEWDNGTPQFLEQLIALAIQPFQEDATKRLRQVESLRDELIERKRDISRLQAQVDSLTAELAGRIEIQPGFAQETKEHE